MERLVLPCIKHIKTIMEHTSYETLFPPKQSEVSIERPKEVPERIGEEGKKKADKQKSKTYSSSKRVSKLKSTVIKKLKKIEEEHPETAYILMFKTENGKISTMSSFDANPSMAKELGKICESGMRLLSTRPQINIDPPFVATLPENTKGAVGNSAIVTESMPGSVIQCSICDSCISKMVSHPANKTIPKITPQKRKIEIPPVKTQLKFHDWVPKPSNIAPIKRRKTEGAYSVHQDSAQFNTGTGALSQPTTNTEHILGDTSRDLFSNK